MVGASLGATKSMTKVNLGRAVFARLNIAGFLLTAGMPAAWGQAALNYVPVSPCRAADTRTAASPLGGPFIGGNTSRSLTIPNSACGIPGNAQAYALNVAVVPHSALGYLTVWPTGQTQPPTVATLNSVDGR